VLGRLDRWQREHQPAAFVVAVWKKFGDDDGGKLVTVTILGYVLDGRPDLQEKILDSAVSQFPIIGDQLNQNVSSLKGNAWAIVIGVGTALWGGLGVSRAGQEVMATVWNVPRRHRPGFVPRILRGLLLLVVLAFAVVSTAGLTTLATALDEVGFVARIGLTAAALVLNVGWFLLAFRTLAARPHPWREVLPGAIVGAVGFQVLLLLGTAIVDRQLSGATSSYGFFGVVLGLLAWLALLATVFVYSAEVNPVLAAHLWPRSAFTAGLTEQDRTVLTSEVQAEVRAPHQAVSVSYDGEAPAEAEDPAANAEPADEESPAPRR
jgi:uncharacterized BrkB/YihY/UPF0761 family membrane protein